MICSGCGKDIPMGGVVCPYCHRDKTGDANAHLLGYIFGAVGAFIGYFIGELWGLFIGMVIGVIIGAVMGGKSGTAATKPPEVRLAPNQHIAATVEITNPIPLRRKGIAQEIEKLQHLFLQGVITAEEFERGKTLFLGAPPDKASTAVDLLQNLATLKEQGVLSESEFNTKKWEILSERLMPGRKQAANIHQPQTSPTQRKPEYLPQVGNIFCPTCGKGIATSNVFPGLNVCPHCDNSFEAEI